ncbi:MAG TPA: tetratricopeptide repeat protein [Vicinamibacterales bacterium]|jgi:tetratricopeptide (TPR) repeat protein|nr:tetratricopeptide repeat protein [Vicinamibacterales bacterium]
MRTLAALVLAGLIAAATACAPKSAPTVNAAAPRYPDVVRPPVPVDLAGTKAASAYDLGWNQFQAGDLRTAARAYASALQANPAFYPAEAASGYLELARNDAGAALLHFDRALTRRPDYASALVGRGQTLLDLNRDDDAIAAFESAIAADPSLADGLRSRIDVLKVRSLERHLVDARNAARANRNDEAIRLYQSAIARSPESGLLYRELAIVERRANQTEPALEHFRQAVALDPNDAVAWAQIGELLEAQDDTEGALSAYASSLAGEANPAVESKRDALRSRIALSRLPEEYQRIPEAPQVTRADLAALIALRLGPLLQSRSTGDAAVITDVRSSWAEPWIMSVVRAGVMEPFENHTFQPAAAVRRLDLAQIVNRVLPLVAVIDPNAARTWQNAAGRFSDINQANVAYAAASAAVASGAMSVAQNQAFEPSRVVTGAEAVSAVRRLEQLARLPPGGSALVPPDTPVRR